MEISRRKFIGQSGALMLGAAALNTTNPGTLLAETGRAASPRKPTLVVVYLRGGADALNTIIPYKEKLYHAVRPSIAIPGPDAKDDHKVIPLDETFGLNPNLEGINQLYRKGMCAPIVCVGSNHETRSHFSAQDYMERGAPGMANVTTGWLARYLSSTQTAHDSPLRSIVLQPLLPRSLRGNYPVLAAPASSSESAMKVFQNLYREMPGMKQRQDLDKARQPAASALTAIFSAMKQRQDLDKARQTRFTIQQSGTRTIEQLRQLNRIIASADSQTVKYPQSPFGNTLKKTAKVIKADQGLEVTAVDYRGWDHHTDEGPVDGALGGKLADLGDSLKSFTDDLEGRMDKTLVLVMSEFGRTVKENGNQGTDHGHGGFMLAIGGMVRGGQVYGKWTGLEDPQLYRKRDLPVHTDFRNVFAETLRQVFGYNSIKEGLFPEYTRQAPPLEILNQV